MTKEQIQQLEAFLVDNRDEAYKEYEKYMKDTISCYIKYTDHLPTKMQEYRDLENQASVALHTSKIYSYILGFIDRQHKREFELVTPEEIAQIVRDGMRNRLEAAEVLAFLGETDMEIKKPRST